MDKGLPLRDAPKGDEPIMPEMNGRDLAKTLVCIRPHIRRRFMSGYIANVIAHHDDLDDGAHFIQKPFSMTGLGTGIRECTEGLKPHPATCGGAAGNCDKA